MKFTKQDIELIKSSLAACKVLGIDGIVLGDGLVRGAKPSLDAAIISEAKLSIDPSIKIGIGRVIELDKRLGVFTSDVDLEGKCNDAGDVSMLTLSSGKTKMQFRCTAAALMRFPKSNDDTPAATISMTRAEAQQIARAAKTLGSETVTLQVTRDGAVRVECTDSALDKFEIELSQAAKYEDEETSLVQTYLANLFIDVLDTMSKEREEIDFIVGEVGSITALIKQHTMLLMPLLQEEE